MTMPTYNQETVEAFALAVQSLRELRSARTTVLLCKCAWCGHVTGLKESAKPGTSHGICAECAEKAMKSIKE